MKYVKESALSKTSGTFLERAIKQGSATEKEHLNDLEDLARNHESSQKLQILRQKHALNDVIDQFEQTKEALTKRMCSYNDRQNALSQKQKDMTSQVERFEQFIIDNDEKVKRANQIIKRERSTQNQKQDEISTLKAKLKDEIELKEMMMSRLKNISQYKDFVLSLDDDIENITKRSDMLTDSNAALRRDLQSIQNKTEEIQSIIPVVQSEFTFDTSIPLDEFQNLREKIVMTRSALSQELDERKYKQQKEFNIIKERTKLFMAIRYEFSLTSYTFLIFCFLNILCISRNLHERCSQSTSMKIATLDVKQDSIDYLCRCLDSICNLIIDLKQIDDEFETLQ